MRVSIRELAGAVLPKAADPRVVAVLRAYLDESFNKQRMLIAGFIGPVEEWETVAVKWAAVLKDHGAPYYHGSEMKAQRRAFSSWETWRCRALADACAKVIAESNLGEIQSAFVGEWAAILAAAPALSERFPNAYSFCFEDAVSRMQRAAAKWYGADVVACVFDMKDAHEARARKLVEARQAAGQWANIHSVTYADDKKQIELQCADMLAHEVLQCPGKGAEFQSTLPLIGRLHKPGRYYNLGRQWDETLLNEYRRDPTLKSIFDPKEVPPPTPEEHDRLVELVRRHSA